MRFPNKRLVVASYEKQAGVVDLSWVFMGAYVKKYHMCDGIRLLIPMDYISVFG